MKVIALGGAGEMGRVAVRFAAESRQIGEVVIADRDMDAAGRLAGELAAAPCRLSVQALDVTDRAALDRALRGADAVINTVGPFYRFGVPILEAAIEAGVNYLDICDDWEPTLDMLALGSRAEASGVTAIIGMGASPGLSNLMALRAARELDEVHDLYTVWPVDADLDGRRLPLKEAGAGLTRPDGSAAAALVHWMQQISGGIRVVQQGKPADVAPLQPIWLRFPGRGSGTVYTVGHPEPLTMRETLNVRGRSACLMVLSKGALALLRDLRKAIDQKRLTNEQAAAIMLAPGAWRMTKASVNSLWLKGRGALPAFFAFATGSKDGKAARVGATVTGSPVGMANATGVPLALGLAQLIEGRIQVRGVFAPDAVIEPDRLFDQIAPYCEPPLARGSDLVKVTIALE